MSEMSTEIHTGFFFHVEEETFLYIPWPRGEGGAPLNTAEV